MLEIRREGQALICNGGENILLENVHPDIYIRDDGVETLVWQYDTTAPTFNLNVKDSFKTLSATVLIKGTVTDTESGFDSLTINGASVSVDENGYFEYTLYLPNETTYIFTLVAKDKANNTNTKVLTVQHLPAQTADLSNMVRTGYSGAPYFRSVSNYDVEYYGVYYANTNTIGDSSSNATYSGYYPAALIPEGCTYAEVTVHKYYIHFDGRYYTTFPDTETVRYNINAGENLYISTSNSAHNSGAATAGSTVGSSARAGVAKIVFH